MRVRGTRLHVERSGTGPPLLWLTGFALSAAVFDPVLPLYEDDWECLRYDPRGAGRSAAPLRPTTTAELAADAVGVLDALGVDSAHVYGLSMGGLVAQEMALRFPERVRGLVLGGTSAGGPRAVLPGAAGLAAMGRTPLSGGARARWLGGALLSPQFRQEHPDQARQLLQLLGAHRAPPHGVLAHWWASSTHDTGARLHRVQAPTLVLHGQRDLLVPVANARYLARRIPHAELHLLPGAGHAYLWEQPEASAALLRDWHARTSAAAGQPLRGAARLLEPASRALAVPLGGLGVPRRVLGALTGQLRRL